MGQTDVGVKEITLRPQHAPHLGEKTLDRRIAERGFDVDHGVERRILERKRFGVALDELEAVDLMHPTTKGNCPGGNIEPDDTPRLEVALHIGSAAAAATTYFEHVALPQVDPRRNPMIEIGRVALRPFVTLELRQPDHVVARIAVVHELPELGATKIECDQLEEPAPQVATHRRRALRKR